MPLNDQKKNIVRTLPSHIVTRGVICKWRFSYNSTWYSVGICEGGVAMQKELYASLQSCFGVACYHIHHFLQLPKNCESYYSFAMKRTGEFSPHHCDPGRVQRGHFKKQMTAANCRGRSVCLFESLILSVHMLFKYPEDNFDNIFWKVYFY